MESTCSWRPITETDLLRDNIFSIINKPIIYIKLKFSTFFFARTTCHVDIEVDGITLWANDHYTGMGHCKGQCTGQ